MPVQEGEILVSLDEIATVIKIVHSGVVVLRQLIMLMLVYVEKGE